MRIFGKSKTTRDITHEGQGSTFLIPADTEVEIIRGTDKRETPHRFVIRGPGQRIPANGTKPPVAEVFTLAVDADALELQPIKCHRTQCDAAANFQLVHRDTGYFYCPRCARRINEYNPGIIPWPRANAKEKISQEASQTACEKTE